MYIIYLVKIIDFVLKNISVSTILYVITQCTTVLNVQDLTLLYRVLKSYAKLANGGIFFGWLCEIFSIVLVSFMLTTLSEFCVNSIQWFFFYFFIIYSLYYWFQKVPVLRPFFSDQFWSWNLPSPKLFSIDCTHENSC